MTFARYANIDIAEKNLPPIFGIRDLPLVSLEEATEPLELKVLGLKEQVKYAKKNCHFPSEHGLTKDESAAVYLYTIEATIANFYEVLNKNLRQRDRSTVRPWLNYLKLFFTAVEKLPLVKGNLWRGVRVDVSKSFNRDEEFTWWSISSCSLHISVISQFLTHSGTLFMIEALNGRNISGYSSVSSENEVILLPGTELHVVDNSLDHSSGLHIIHLRQVSDVDDTNETNSGSSSSSVSKKTHRKKLISVMANIMTVMLTIMIFTMVAVYLLISREHEVKEHLRMVS